MWQKVIIIVLAGLAVFLLQLYLGAIIFTINLPLVMVVWLALAGNKAAGWLALITGLLMDLASGLFPINTAVLLVICLALGYFTIRFSVFSPLSRILLIFISVSLYLFLCWLMSVAIELFNKQANLYHFNLWLWPLITFIVLNGLLLAVINAIFNKKRKAVYLLYE